MSSLGKLARGAMWPVRRLLDPRFADVARRIEYANNRVIDESHQLNSHIAVRQSELTALVGTFGAASNESLAFLGRQIREFEGTMEALGDRVAAIETVMGPVFYSRKVDAVIAGGVENLDPSTAALLGYAEGHRGFSAQRRLWTNPPLTLAYGENDVKLGSVNERIVEIPYVFAALGTLRPPAKILDVGSVESTIPLSLAGLGYAVTALDLREYPFPHPNLEIAVSRLEDFDRPDATYDAITCISTIEHVGLGWYGEQRQDDGGDKRFLNRLGELLKPDGILVLTVPFGRASIDEVQRTYDDATLDALLDGWEVTGRDIVRQHDDATWAPGDVEDPDARAVALVTARRPG